LFLWIVRERPKSPIRAIYGCPAVRLSPWPYSGGANMKLAHILLAGLLVTTAVQAQPPARSNAMQLGNFSVSLNVRDINASKAFYEKLGFTQVFGNVTQHFVIMQSGTTNIGLFQGMFPR